MRIKLGSACANTIMLATIAGSFGASGAYADPSGRRKRPNGDVVPVSGNDGISSYGTNDGGKSGFEMCNSMAGGGNAWLGASMKHADMPAFTSFDRTVRATGNSLSIKGCAIGGSVCGSEAWSRAN